MLICLSSAKIPIPQAILFVHFTQKFSLGESRGGGVGERGGAPRKILSFPAEPLVVYADEAANCSSCATPWLGWSLTPPPPKHPRKQ